ncbi:MAG: hypothetical protein ACKO2C_03935 [Actinomycetes bacterium]
MSSSIRIGTRVKTPVFSNRKGRHFLHGHVVDLIRHGDGHLAGIDTGTARAWFPLEELLAD